MKILTFTSLFPNAAQPHQGLFVNKRLRELMADFPVNSTVVAPVPWFPKSAPAGLGRYNIFSEVPDQQCDGKLQIYHPRYAVIPKVSWRFSPRIMWLGARRTVQRLYDTSPFVLIDAHFFYPDGVAAVMLAKQLNVPVCITARGSDINLMSRYVIPRRYIKWAAANASALITVSKALKDTLISLGVDGEKITVLRNGIDLDMFQTVDRSLAKNALGMPVNCLLSVGNLVDLKGHDLIIKALPKLPGVSLWIVGTGPQLAKLQAAARECGVSDRVKFVGQIPQSELAEYYSAADALVLASSREGWANVLLESMACGTPAIGTRVGGTPELITEPAAGTLMAERSVTALIDAYHELDTNRVGPAETRRYAEKFDWHATSEGQYKLFDSLVAK